MACDTQSVYKFKFERVISDHIEIHRIWWLSLKKKQSENSLIQRFLYKIHLLPDSAYKTRFVLWISNFLWLFVAHKITMTIPRLSPRLNSPLNDQIGNNLDSSLWVRSSILLVVNFFLFSWFLWILTSWSLY